MKTKIGSLITILINLLSVSQFNGQSIIKDIDGNTYNTVTIGNQTWMKENLKTTHYQNGDSIYYISDSSYWGRPLLLDSSNAIIGYFPRGSILIHFKNPNRANLHPGEYCFYDNNPQHDNVFGRIYNGYVITDERKICPKGFHIPSTQDWDQLFNTLGGFESATKKLRSTKYWKNNENGSDVAGFSLLPSGIRWFNGEFRYLGEGGYYWRLDSYYSEGEIIVFEGNSYKAYSDGVSFLGAAVRCIKN